MSADSRERRPDPRLAVEMPVRISTIDPEIDPNDGKPFFRASDEVVADVSRSGAFVPTDEPIAAGRRLLVEIEIPDGERIQAVGRVVWSRRPTAGPARGEGDGESVAARAARKAGIGIQFLVSSSRQLGTLRDYVERGLAERTAASEAPRKRRSRSRKLPPSATA